MVRWGNSRQLPMKLDHPIFLRSNARRLRLVSGALGPLAGLLLVIAFFTAADQWRAHQDAARLGQPVSATFFTLRTFWEISVQAATVAVAALGMTMIIIAGGIDLSAGIAVTLSATVLAWSLKAGYGVPLSVIAGVGT